MRLFCCNGTGLMKLLGFCGFHGPTTFLLALVTAVFVLLFPGANPHDNCRNMEIIPELQHWCSPGLRIPGMLAAQLQICFIAFRCFRQILSLQSTPGQHRNSQTLLNCFLSIALLFHAAEHHTTWLNLKALSLPHQMMPFIEASAACLLTNNADASCWKAWHTSMSVPSIPRGLHAVEAIVRGRLRHVMSRQSRQPEYCAEAQFHFLEMMTISSHPHDSPLAA